MKQLDDAIEQFIKTAHHVTLSQEVYADGWSAKEIIAHLVFWHEYYVTVLKALANDEDPPLMEGTAEKNKFAAPIAKKNSREELLNRLVKAQQKFKKYIVLVKIPLIPYNKTAMKRPPKDYVSVIAKHVAKHEKDLHKALKK
ncbi:hypothetical protein KC571_02090 [candidate division WWE3 bacterium]|uniref:DinB family protein n=1 Tax=candidate division WWE3 bacterium TaxID=2053526 RepID=A0A955LGK2_UNCKA|nr:hypothetical protein [candidate division WWE3 bacterium]